MYRLVYSETCREQIRTAHPKIKLVLKSRLERLKIDPYFGKRLERELSGYWSIRAKRFRIIYKARESQLEIEIHYVGHRKDVYQLFRENIGEG